MNVQELFNIGIQFMNEGKEELAVDLLQRCIKLDRSFSPPFLNLHNFYRTKGNLPMALEMLTAFANCPVNMFTIDSKDKVRQEITALQHQIEDINKTQQVQSSSLVKPQ